MLSFLDKAIRLNVFAASAGMAAIIVAFAGQARAATELNCFPARTLVGDNNPAPWNRVVKTYVRHSARGGLYFTRSRIRRLSIAALSTP